MCYVFFIPWYFHGTKGLLHNRHKVSTGFILALTSLSDAARIFTKNNSGPLCGEMTTSGKAYQG